MLPPCSCKVRGHGDGVFGGLRDVGFGGLWHVGFGVEDAETWRTGGGEQAGRRAERQAAYEVNRSNKRHQQAAGGEVSC